MSIGGSIRRVDLLKLKDTILKELTNVKGKKDIKILLNGIGEQNNRIRFEIVK